MQHKISPRAFNDLNGHVIDQCIWSMTIQYHYLGQIGKRNILNKSGWIITLK